MDRTVTWASLEAGDTTEPAARARWLEERLVGLDLAPVIDELAALTGDPAGAAEVPMETVRSWLGPHATVVLQQGLDRLPVGKIDELFRQPGMLAGLQELVLVEGGGHWNARVRANPETERCAALHRRIIAEGLGIEPSPRDGLAPKSKVELSSASTGQVPLPLRIVHRSAGSRNIRRAMLWFAPLAAAAAALALLATGRRDAERPATPAAPAGEGFLIVRADAPAADASPDAPRQVPESSWPDHPWESLTSSSPGPKRATTQPQEKASPILQREDWAVGSRQWSQRLEQASDLSPAQLRAAAARARGAVGAIEALVTAGGSGLANGESARLEATCRKVAAEIDRVQSGLGTEPHERDGLMKAKQQIVRSLGEIEGVLGGESAAAVESAGDAGEDGAGRLRP